MALTAEQRNVLAHILRVAKQRGASPKEVKAAIETGLVESNLSNPAGGTSDSQGWRQERASLYKDPRNLDASINRFFNETSAVKNQYGRAGDLAAAVQRPAAQYRGRYQGRSQEAQALLGGGVGAAPSMPSAGTPATTRTVGAVDNSAQRGALIASFLGTKGADPLQFAMGIRGLQDTPGTRVTTSARQNLGAAAAAPPAAGNFKPGDPVIGGTSVGGRHETAGLAGFPARDYFARPGATVVAPAAGKVVKLSGHDPSLGAVQGAGGPLGWSTYIQGADGRTYFLTHMGSRNVQVGQTVRPGQPIGTVANYDKYGRPSHIHMGVSG